MRRFAVIAPVPGHSYFTLGLDGVTCECRKRFRDRVRHAEHVNLERMLVRSASESAS